MNLRIAFVLIIFSSIFHMHSKAQNLTFAEIEALAQSPNFFLKKDFDYYLENHDSVDFKIISKPFDLGGLFIQQYSIPVLRNYLDEIDTDILFYFDSTSTANGQIVFHNTPNLEEIKVQLSIEELYQIESYFDYLILRGQRPSLSWEDIAVSVGMDPNEIIQFKNGARIDSLLIESYNKTEGFKQRHGDYLHLYQDDLPFFELQETPIDGSWYFDYRQGYNSPINFQCCKLSDCVGREVTRSYKEKYTDLDNVALAFLVRTATSLLIKCPVAVYSGEPSAVKGCLQTLGMQYATFIYEYEKALYKCQEDPCLGLDPSEFDECDIEKFCVATRIDVEVNDTTIETRLLNFCMECPEVTFETTRDELSVDISFNYPLDLTPEEIEAIEDRTKYSLDYLIINETSNDIIQNGKLESNNRKINKSFSAADFETDGVYEICIFPNGWAIECESQCHVFSPDCPEITEFEYDENSQTILLGISEGNLIGNYQGTYNFTSNGQIFSPPGCLTNVTFTGVTDLECDLTPPFPSKDYCVEINVLGFPECEDESCIKIGQCDLPENKTSVVVPNDKIECETKIGANDGKVTVELAPGSNAIKNLALYTYSNQLVATGQIGVAFTGLGAGTYIIKFDSEEWDCPEEDQVVVCIGCKGKPTAQTEDCFKVESAANNETASSANDGSIVVSVTDLGTSVLPYHYYWSDIPGSTDLNERTDLAPGEYCVQVYDDACCFVEDVCEEICPFSQIVPLSTEPESCIGQNDGVFHYMIEGEGGPFDIKIGTTTNSISNNVETSVNNLSAGSYTLTVTDRCGKVMTHEFVIESGATTTPEILNSATGTWIFGTTNCTGAFYAEVTGGIPPYEYIWSNGHNEPFIGGLEPGTYTLTVVDACQQMTTKDFVVEPSSININLKVTHPTDCEIADGKISALFGGNISGGTPPYTYLWNTGQTVASIHGLSPGLYTITVADSEGCTSIKSYELISADEPNLYLVAKTSSCINNPTGTLQVAAFAADAPGTKFNFSWDDDNSTQTLNANYSDVFGLKAGEEYCVTVSNVNSDCQTSDCFTIDPRPSNGPLTIQFADSGSICFGSNGGSITATAAGGTPPHTFTWANGSSGPTNFNLDPGNYIVTVTDDCGRTFAASHDLQSLGAQMVLEPTFSGCSGLDAQIEMQVNGGTPPFNFQWSPGNNNTSSVVNIYADPEMEEVSLTVTDANGCTVNWTSQSLPFGEIEIEAISLPCVGFNDGEFILHLRKNVPDAVVQLLIDGEPHFGGTTTPEGDFSITLNDLEGDSFVSFEFTFGGCTLSESIRIPSVPRESNYLNPRLQPDGSWTCVTEQSCNGVPIGEIEIPSTVNLSNPSTRPCAFPIICNDEEVAWDLIRPQWLQGAEYADMLNIAITSVAYGYRDIAIALRDDFFGGTELMQCYTYKVCPASLKIMSKGHPNQVNVILGQFLNPWDWGSDDIVETELDPETGCISYNCPGLLNDFDLCPGTNTPPGVTGDPGPNSCHLSSQNVAQLLEWRDDIINDPNVEGFEGSSLDNFLTGLTAFERVKANCSTVLYCIDEKDPSDKFKFQYSNIETVLCSELTPPQVVRYFELNVNTGEYLPTSSPIYNTCEIFRLDGNQDVYRKYVACGSVFAPQQPIIRTINNNYPGSGVLRKGGKATTNTVLKDSVKVVNDSFINEELINFGFVISDNIVVPKGIVQADNGSVFYEYDHDSYYPSKFKSHNLEFLVDDWDLKEEYSIEKIPTDLNARMVNCVKDKGDSWHDFLRSDSFIEIEHFSKVGNYIYIGGIYQGNLSYSSNIIASLDIASAGFILKLSAQDGSVISFNRIEGIDSDFRVKFSENIDGEINMICKSLSNHVILNNSNYSLPSHFGSGALIAKLTPNNNFNIINQIDIPTINNNVSCLGITQSKDKSKIVIAAYSNLKDATNSGSISFNSIGSGSLILIYLNQDGTFSHINRLDNILLDNEKFDLTFKNSDDLFIGVTYMSDFIANGNIVKSKGNRDVALIKMSTIGNIEWIKDYGGPMDETVSELLFDNDVLFFGGELGGEDAVRLIGKYEFVWIGGDQTTYISYVFDPSNDVFITKPNTKFGSHEKGISKVDLEVYPNPFNDKFWVNFIGIRERQEVEIQELKVFNSIGQLVLTKNVSGQKKAELDLSEFSNGVFYIRALDEFKGVVSSKKIIKQ